MIWSIKIGIHFLYLSVVCIMLLLYVTGCRQETANPPQHYQQEIDQARLETLRSKQLQQENKYLKDGYSWRDNKDTDPCLPCSIGISDQKIKAEIEHLHESIHGKKKNRIRFRN